eukprot:4370833-Amphidinium_carterae.1
MKPFLAQAYTAPCTPAMQRSILGYTRAKDDRTFEVRQQQTQAKRDAELMRLDLLWPRLQTTRKPGLPTRVDKYLDAVYGLAARVQWDELAKVESKHPPLGMSASAAVLEQALQTAHAVASSSAGSGQMVDVADLVAIDLDAEVDDQAQQDAEVEDQADGDFLAPVAEPLAAAAQQAAEEQPGKRRQQWFIEFKNAMHAQHGWGPFNVGMQLVNGLRMGAGDLCRLSQG